MILFSLLLSQAQPYESTPQEIAICLRQSDQPERFCMADRKHDRAEKELAVAMVTARRAALAQKRAIAQFSREVGGVTLEGNPVEVLEASHRAWLKSYRSDCLLAGLALANGNAGTEGVTANWACEANRILDRVDFLKRTLLSGR